jgi:hypothetical protein
MGLSLFIFVFISSSALAQDVSISTAFKTQRGKTKIRIDGKTSLPDETVLRITLYRLDERAAGGRLDPVATVTGSALAPVARKTFFAEPTVQAGGGCFRAVLELIEEDQTPDAQLALKGKSSTRRWEIPFHQWSDEYVPALPKSLVTLDGFRQDAITLVDRVERIAVNADLWKKESPAVIKEAEQLLKKLTSSLTRGSFPAAHAEVVSVVSNLLASLQLLKWNADGSLEGVWDYHTGNKAKTHKHEDFSWDALRRYLEAAGDIGGREMGLWFVKEFQRTRATKGRAAAALNLRAALGQVADHAGVVPHVKQLDGYFAELNATVAEERVSAIADGLAAIEAKLRETQPAKK